jgi:hypothetical protein
VGDVSPAVPGADGGRRKEAEGSDMAFNGYKGPWLESLRSLPDGPAQQDRRAWDLRIEGDCGVTIVTGSFPNLFGHALFRLGRRVGYMHVDQLYDYPSYIPYYDFDFYLKSNGKSLIYHDPIRIPNAPGALTRLQQLRMSKWVWLVVPHNCVRFCEQIIRAGGGSWFSTTNLPILSAAADSLWDHTLGRLFH